MERSALIYRREASRIVRLQRDTFDLTYFEETAIGEEHFDVMPGRGTTDIG